MFWQLKKLELLNAVGLLSNSAHRDCISARPDLKLVWQLGSFALTEDVSVQLRPRTAKMMKISIRAQHVNKRQPIVLRYQCLGLGRSYNHHYWCECLQNPIAKDHVRPGERLQNSDQQLRPIRRQPSKQGDAPDCGVQNSSCKSLHPMKQCLKVALEAQTMKKKSRY